MGTLIPSLPRFRWSTAVRRSLRLCARAAATRLATAGSPLQREEPDNRSPRGPFLSRRAHLLHLLCRLSRELTVDGLPREPSADAQALRRLVDFGAIDLIPAS
jgi:hypothetical protein